MREAAPTYAEALLEGIVAAVRPVATYPNIGRKVPGFDRESLREVIFQGYRIVYVIRGETIYVAHVFHGAMDVTARLWESESD